MVERTKLDLELGLQERLQTTSQQTQVLEKKIPKSQAMMLGKDL